MANLGNVLIQNRGMSAFARMDFEKDIDKCVKASADLRI